MGLFYRLGDCQKSAKIERMFARMNAEREGAFPRRSTFSDMPLWLWQTWGVKALQGVLRPYRGKSGFVKMMQKIFSEHLFRANFGRFRGRSARLLQLLVPLRLLALTWLIEPKQRDQPLPAPEPVGLLLPELPLLHARLSPHRLEARLFFPQSSSSQ
jgi:hypothetical protein